MFQHFGQRLKRDLKHIVDRRLEATAVASGSQVRVCSTLFLASTFSLTAISVFRRRGRSYLSQAPTLRCLVWRLSARFSCKFYFIPLQTLCTDKFRIARVLLLLPYQGTI